MKHLAAGPLDLRGQQTGSGCLGDVVRDDDDVLVGPLQERAGDRGPEATGAVHQTGPAGTSPVRSGSRPASVQHVVAYSLLRQARDCVTRRVKKERPSGSSVRAPRSYLAGRAEFRAAEPEALSHKSIGATVDDPKVRPDYQG